MEEEKKENLMQKIGSLGGHIKLNQKNKGLYLGNSNMSKEVLFGQRGPLHPGMAYNKGEMVLSSVESDTSADLIKELMDKGLTREEAVQTIKDLLREGVLTEVYDPDLQTKVLVFKEG